MVALRAVLIGMLLALVGHIPKNLIFAANLQYAPQIPWLIVPTALYLWVFWRYLNGAWAPESTRQFRRESLRANALPARLWVFALLAGVLGIVALMMVLRVVNRLVVLPEQEFFDVSHASTATVIAVIVVGAIVAGVVEEAAFRGYMQGPIEREHGIIAAVLTTGFMFALAHLGLTPILLPYYIAVAALYGVITHLTNSILPAIVLHTAGNIFSSTYLWRMGYAEWQRSAGPAQLIWEGGPDVSFWSAMAWAAGAVTLCLAAYVLLAREAARMRNSSANATSGVAPGPDAV